MNTLRTVGRSTGTERPLASGVLSRTSAFYVPDSITVSFLAGSSAPRPCMRCTRRSGGSPLLLLPPTSVTTCMTEL